MNLQFQRGMYAAAYGISGAINDMIDRLEQKPKKRLRDYQKCISDISHLCRTQLKKPGEKTEVGAK